MRIGRFNIPLLMLLLVFVPITIVLEFTHVAPQWVFVSACIAIIPLAGFMGTSTEHLSAHYGAGIGGLLNATFGNAAEFIIAIMALRQGLYSVVKASLTGSIIGNVLLVLGLALLLGGLRHPRQKFNRTAAGLGGTLLLLSAIGLLVPTLFHLTGGKNSDLHIQDLSLAIAVVLLVTYLLSLVFQLKTHQSLFAGERHVMENRWSKGRAIVGLLVATVFVALMSEFLVGSVEHTAKAWGMTEVFVGVVLVAIVGNAAEHGTAVIMAIKNKMDLALTIAVGSGIQIALLIAPALVVLSYMIGPTPMDLEFTPFEVVAVTVGVIAVNFVAADGESHWMEGVMLLAVYVVLGIAFFFLPA
jgi:Ca2+:H+ antiporter